MTEARPCTQALQNIAGSSDVSYSYTGEYLTEIDTISTEYDISYDCFGNKESVSVGGSLLAEYIYNSGDGKLTQINHSNGQKVKYLYDTLERISEIQYNSNGGNTFSTAYRYTYDASGSPIGFRYRNSGESSGVFHEYIYGKNIQGDILYIFGLDGTLYASYVYDAWEKQSVTYYNSGNNNNLVPGVKYNPFTYRGYYYDSETGLYYLNSRYYDPEVGRFISPDTTDVLTATPGALTDKNLYACCDNNPVMREDKDGQFWNFIIGGAVGAVIGGVVAAVSSYKETGSVNIWKVAIGVAGGAVSGVVAASGLGWFAQAAITAGISGLSDLENQTVDIIENGGSVADYDVLRTMKEAALGGFTSAAGSGQGALTGRFITGTSNLANQAFDNYLGKTFSAGLRKEAGRSSSALLRQAGRYLGESVFYDNITRGVSSCIGSFLSLWNLER